MVLERSWSRKVWKQFWHGFGMVALESPSHGVLSGRLVMSPDVVLQVKNGLGVVLVSSERSWSCLLRV